MAEEADCVETYRDQVLRLFAGKFGFDSAFTGRTVDGELQEFASHGYDRSNVSARLGATMDEFTPDELRSMCTSGFTIDREFLSARRRDQLAVYRQLLRPGSNEIIIAHVWRNRFGVFGLHMQRSGFGATVSHLERQALNEAAAQLELAEIGWARTRPKEPGATASDGAAWGDAMGLTRSEIRVLGLVIRGLRNSEVAAVSQKAEPTIRNQLASIFRKAQVTTRAELVYQALAYEQMSGVSASPTTPRRWVSHVPDKAFRAKLDQQRSSLG